MLKLIITRHLNDLALNIKAFFAVAVVALCHEKIKRSYLLEMRNDVIRLICISQFIAGLKPYK